METIIAVITLSTGHNYEINQETYNQILEAAPEDLITLPNGTIFKSSAIMEIEGLEDYLKRDFKEGYGQPYNQTNDFEFIKEKYAIFNFPQIMELAQKVYNQVKDFDRKQFQDYCFDKKAITINGEITTTRITDKDGITKFAPFAYPFFIDLWNLAQRKKEKVAYAKEMSWDQLEKGMGFEGVIARENDPKHIELMAKGLQRSIDSRKSEGLKTSNAEKLLELMRQRYVYVKNLTE